MSSPGWYTDPQNPGQWRYWDGYQWTDHRSPRERPSLAVDAQGGAAASQSVGESSRPNHRRTLLQGAVGLAALFAVLGGLALLGYGSGSGTSENGGLAGALGGGPPSEQREFVGLVDEWRQTYVEAREGSLDRNEFRAGEQDQIADFARENRDRQICQLLASGAAFEGWTGELTNVHEDEGKAGASIVLPGGVVALETNRYVSSDDYLENPTMVAPGSGLFADLTSLSVGQDVRVSGEFVPSLDGEQCARTSNLLYSDSVTSPDFTVRITSIQPD